MRVMSGWALGGRWCLYGSCVERWPADLLEPLSHVRGEVPQTGHHPSILSWIVVLWYSSMGFGGFSKLFTGGRSPSAFWGLFCFASQGFTASGFLSLRGGPSAGA
eukprot:5448259-Prymnesium_polylepis.1